MNPRRETREAESYLPLSPQDFEVLVLLVEGPLHGYGIVQAAEAGGGVTALELGSLYRIIGRMLEDGLIEEVDPPEAPADGRRRRFYGATVLGHAVARAEARRLRALLSTPRVSRLARGS
jgi:PadR family transcriptional regulator